MPTKNIENNVDIVFNKRMDTQIEVYSYSNKEGLLRPTAATDESQKKLFCEKPRHRRIHTLSDCT